MYFSVNTSYKINMKVKKGYSNWWKCGILTVIILCGCGQGNDTSVESNCNMNESEVVISDMGNELPVPTKEPSLKEKVESSGNAIWGENEYNAIWGETGAFIWKYVEATFEKSAYYRSGFLAEHDNWTTSVTSYHGDLYSTGWETWSGLDEFSVEHVGDDIFHVHLRGDYAYGSYYNNPKKECIFSTEDFNRHGEFNDGYAVGIYEQEYWLEPERDYYLALLDETGNIIKSEVAMKRWEYDFEESAGIYSNGLFYYDGIFYDINFNKILDFSNRDFGKIYTKQYVYAPYFQEDICTMITYKNGKYWIFDIDKSGEIISEVEEFDLTLLNY